MCQHLSCNTPVPSWPLLVPSHPSYPWTQHLKRIVYCHTLWRVVYPLCLAHYSALGWPSPSWDSAKSSRDRFSSPWVTLVGLSGTTILPLLAVMSR